VFANIAFLVRAGTKVLSRVREKHPERLDGRMAPSQRLASGALILPPWGEESAIRQSDVCRSFGPGIPGSDSRPNITVFDCMWCGTSKPPFPQSICEFHVLRRILWLFSFDTTLVPGIPAAEEQPMHAMVVLPAIGVERCSDTAMSVSARRHTRVACTSGHRRRGMPS
jgi:hypothetical protein